MILCILVSVGPCVCFASTVIYFFPIQYIRLTVARRNYRTVLSCFLCQRFGIELSVSGGELSLCFSALPVVFCSCAMALRSAFPGSLPDLKKLCTLTPHTVSHVLSRVYIPEACVWRSGRVTSSNEFTV